MSKKSAVIWSHTFFLVPLVIAFANQLYLYSSVILSMVMVSFIYHSHPRPHWRILDRLTALALIFGNFYLFFKTTFVSGYFASAILLALVAFIFFFKAKGHEYYHYHAAWHILSAFITICSVVNYITY